jgi:hypothetical protein
MNLQPASASLTVFGKPAMWPFAAFQPAEHAELMGIRTCNGFNGKPYGTPQADCHACHCVMTGSAIACSYHGFRRISTAL